MTVTIKDLRGTRIKKSLDLHTVVKRWHNKNKSGGNFGINLYPTSQRTGYTRGGEFKKAPAYELTGYHTPDGTIYSLTFAELYQAVGPKLITKKNYKTVTYTDLMKAVAKQIEREQKGGRVPIKNLVTILKGKMKGRKGIVASHKGDENIISIQGKEPWRDRIKTYPDEALRVTGGKTKTGGKVMSKRTGRKKPIWKVGDTKTKIRKIRGQNRRVNVKKLAPGKYSIRTIGKPKMTKDGDAYGKGNYRGNRRDAATSSQQSWEKRYKRKR